MKFFIGISMLLVLAGSGFSSSYKVDIKYVGSFDTNCIYDSFGQVLNCYKMPKSLLKKAFHYFHTLEIEVSEVGKCPSKFHIKKLITAVHDSMNYKETKIVLKGCGCICDDRYGSGLKFKCVKSEYDICRIFSTSTVSVV